MNTKIISPGQKLKELRKKYKIKQHEICGTQITRGMISMIETDKAGLTKNTAILITENIKRLCEERNISCNVSLEYLLESEEEQAKKILKNFLELFSSQPEKIFSNSFQEEFGEIEKIINTYQLKDDKYTIYRTIGDIFKKSKEYYKAYSYYLRAFESCTNLFNDVRLIKLIVNIGFCCNHLKRFKETLEFNKLASIYMDDIPEDLNYKIKFNNLIALKNLKEYDLMLIELNQLEITFQRKLNSERIEKVNVMILKANCLKEKKLYIEAISAHRDVLTLANSNIELQLVTLCNLIEIYIELNDSSNLRKYLDRCIAHLIDYQLVNDKIYSSEIYNDIGLGYYTIHEFELSKLYFNKSVIEAKETKNANILLLALNKLLDIAICANNLDEVEELKMQTLEIISLKLLPSNNVLLIKILKYYNSIGRTQTVDDILSFAESLF
ncbi:helix-turn-helix domain-containing protein [Clostridium tunisiense]|uniref:helix-turn-helix domain-containing protein n=1 Tax=Clostridium tunisiense TaxID=219748 RepID=UPI0002F92081|nr:helix-turn-helix transcriptional regulator [Clostridium tunisiense]